MPYPLGHEAMEVEEVLDFVLSKDGFQVSTKENLVSVTSEVAFQQIYLIYFTDRYMFYGFIYFAVVYMLFYFVYTFRCITSSIILPHIYIYFSYFIFILYIFTISIFQGRQGCLYQERKKPFVYIK